MLDCVHAQPAAVRSGTRSLSRVAHRSGQRRQRAPAATRSPCESAAVTRRGSGLRILLLLSAGISAALSVIMLVFLRGHRRHPGFSHWTAATALISATFLCLGFRGLVPNPISIVGVNAAMLAAAPMFLDATRRFLGRSRLARGWYALALVPFGVNLFFYLVVNQETTRTAIQMTASAIAFGATVALLLRQRGAARSLLSTALAAQLALITAGMLARAAWALQHPGVTILSESPAQFAFFGATVVLHLGVTVTFILLTTERVATQLEEANRLLAEASRTDALTGLANRRAFLEVAETEVQRMARTGRAFSFVLGDVDHFKRVNDELGHAAGDAVLRELAARARGAVRKLDAVARWGGEEFVFLLPETPLAGALLAAETVRAAVAAGPFEVDGAALAVTISLGVAEHAWDRTLDATMAIADRALYRAKETGRNRVVAG